MAPHNPKQQAERLLDDVCAVERFCHFMRGVPTGIAATFMADGSRDTANRDAYYGTRGSSICRTARENGLHDGEGAMARGMDSYDAVYSYRGEREREP